MSSGGPPGWATDRKHIVGDIGTRRPSDEPPPVSGSARSPIQVVSCGSDQILDDNERCQSPAQCSDATRRSDASEEPAPRPEPVEAHQPSPKPGDGNACDGSAVHRHDTSHIISAVSTKSGRRSPLRPSGRTPKLAHLKRLKHNVTPVYGNKCQTKSVPLHRDSGYMSRQPTMLQPVMTEFRQASDSVTAPHTSPVESEEDSEGEDTPSEDMTEYMIKQPESSPISADQLATEVKGIYAGLVMVEAKCINIDAAQAAEVNSPLTQEQWQALIALHRTLLYEHHDFLMATQHPTANDALKGLALKYSMPARMWKHAIHAFLEVLRHRRPDSQEYMLAFIYLAYQMVALLLETVPSFTDTWIECLGDLARYRMAIEENKEIHATWGGVAARWYTMASDRNTNVGRLYHHLGILERPSLRKLCFYSKSLTCEIPFTNARDSLGTLCSPIVQDIKTIESSNHSVEARIVTLYALIYSLKDQALIERVGHDALRLLSQQLNKLRELGVNLAISTISGLFELGSASNPLWRLFTTAREQATRNARLAYMKTEVDLELPSLPPPASVSPSLRFSAFFCYKPFNMILHTWQDRSPWKDNLAYVHICLAWQISLFRLPNKTSCPTDTDTFRTLIDPANVSWVGLAQYLNSLTRYHTIKKAIIQHAMSQTFPRFPEKVKNAQNVEVVAMKLARPLSEDYTLRGLAWTSALFDADHFAGQAEDDGRAIETETMRKNRADRVLWLSLMLAFHAKYLDYNEDTKTFLARGATMDPPLEASMTASSAIVDKPPAASDKVSESPSRSSRRTSLGGSSEDGFVVVRNAKARKESGTMRSATSVRPSFQDSIKQRPAKAKQDLNSFRVLDADNDVDMMSWETDHDGSVQHTYAT